MKAFFWAWAGVFLSASFIFLQTIGFTWPREKGLIVLLVVLFLCSFVLVYSMGKNERIREGGHDFGRLIFYLFRFWQRKL